MFFGFVKKLCRGGMGMLRDSFTRGKFIDRVEEESFWL